VVDHLNPGDHFNLISFSTGVHLWQPALQLIDSSSAKAAHAWINGLTATGSTDINRALLEALGQLQNTGNADDKRPAYLLFMTDGLPTQGEIDAQRIIGNALSNKPVQRTIRLFTFGVGFDVNTDLLDTLSQELGGRSSYVKPEEQIDEEISQFYSQISLPVLSDVALNFGNQVVIDEMYPYPLPDLFAGEQLVVVGRYHTGADLSVTLRGVVNNQKIIYQYSNQHFVTTGGEPLVARLWATRKIGALLAQMRRNGTNPATANKELIDEVTNLSLQYGIVTPYTSYLVEEPAVVSQQAPGQAQPQTASEPHSLYAEGVDAVERKVDAAAAAPASGAAAVADSQARTQLETATNVQEHQNVRYVNGKTFTRQGVVTTKDGQTIQLWVDTLYREKMQIEKVVFGSERYFALAKQPQMARWLAISSELVVVVDKNKAIRITTVEP
jgi:Ca-activated chloride channel family protein